MKIKKLHIAFDKTSKASFKKIKFFKKYINYSPQKADIIIVLGGDGFMLQTLKSLGKFNKPFYGMNTGTYGFLMNKFGSKRLMERLSKTKLIKISALEMVVKKKNNTIKRGIAINEISMLRQSKQTAALQIKKGSKIVIKKLISDGSINIYASWKHGIQSFSPWTDFIVEFKTVSYYAN